MFTYNVPISVPKRLPPIYNSNYFLIFHYIGNGKSAKLEVAYGEEMASDLHSSTEELSFQETEDAEKHKRKKSSQIVRIL